MICEEKKK